VEKRLYDGLTRVVTGDGGSGTANTKGCQVLGQTCQQPLLPSKKACYSLGRVWQDVSNADALCLVTARLLANCFDTATRLTHSAMRCVRCLGDSQQLVGRNKRHDLTHSQRQQDLRLEVGPIPPASTPPRPRNFPRPSRSCLPTCRACR